MNSKLFNVMLIVVFFGYIPMTYADSREKAEGKGVIVSLGITVNVVKSNLDKCEYEWTESKQPDTDFIRTSYKPIKAWHPTKKEWLKSYYDLSFKEGLLVAINWYSESGDLITAHMQKLLLCEE